MASSFDQAVDPANDFRDVYHLSKNIQVDDSQARKFYDGDTGRFTRTNNKRGELLYTSTAGFRSIDIELYQYRPYNTKLSVIPYIDSGCQPVVLPAMYQTVGQNAEGWKHKIARFDLRELPMCPTRVLIRLEGGQQGWEMQISRITFKLSGRLERDPALTQSTSSSDEDDDNGVDWWVYLIIIVVAIIVLLAAAWMVRQCAQCSSEGTEKKLPIWNSRAWRRGERAYELDIPGTPTGRSGPPKPVDHSIEPSNSFSFAVQQDVSLER